jgi:hypothetical protein
MTTVRFQFQIFTTFSFFLKKTFWIHVGPDFLKVHIVANPQACRYNPFAESADK